MFTGSSSCTFEETVSRRVVLLCSCLLCLVTIAVYWDAVNSGFVNYDDPLYLLDRPEVQNGLSAESVRWALTSTVEGNWIPLTWLSYLLDVSLFGLNARAHHAVNLLIHLLNTLLLLFALRRMTGYFWRSLVVAALFALHPLHVESVAWIAERKDVLSGFFFMLTLLVYHAYTVRPSIRRYLTVMVVFALGIWSKSMLVTLPFLLLLLDYWPLDRLPVFFGGQTPKGRGFAATLTGSQDAAVSDSATANRPVRLPYRLLVAEKIPLLLLAMFSLAVTFIAQKKAGAMLENDQSNLADNIANALVSYVKYAYKTAVPSGLSVAYPFPASLPLWQPLLSMLFLVAVTVLVVCRTRRSPYLTAGWFWFIGMLVPVIGIVRLGSQAMADRYTYLPLTGLFIMAVWGSAEIASFLKLGQKYLLVAAAVIIGIFSVLSRMQAGYWKDSVVLFTHAAAVVKDNWLAYEKIASALSDRGELSQALWYANESIRMNPRNPEIHIIAGLVYSRLRQRALAIASCRKAIELNPGHEMAHYFLGRNLLFANDLDGAMTEYAILQKINPLRADILLKEIVEVREPGR